MTDAKKLPRYWKPLKRAYEAHYTEEVIRVAAEQLGCSREEAIVKMRAEDAKTELWINDLYQVEVRPMDNDFVHLNIRRRDGAPIHDWRHLQQIKNELIGENCEAVEIYPAEDQKVDTSNKYHLWGMRNPEARFPIGFDYQDVQDDTGSKSPGLRQRSM